MKFSKCLERQKRVVFMIILLLILYYIYFGGFTKSKINNSRYVARNKQTYGNYLSGFFDKSQLESSNLVSKFTNLLPNIKQANIQKILNWENLSEMDDKLSIKNDKRCKFLIIFLNPSDLPSECISEEFRKQKFTSFDSPIIVTKQDLNDKSWREEFYRNLLKEENSVKVFEDHVSLSKLAEDLGDELSNFFKGKSYLKELNEDYLNILLDISLDLEFSDKECKKSVNIKRLWEFGRLYHKLIKNNESSIDGESKYYKEFLAFVYYKCIYGIGSSDSSNETISIEKNTENDHTLNKFIIEEKSDTNKQDSFFQVVACYQLIPTFGIEDNEIVSLGNLCKWEFEKKDFFTQKEIDQKKMHLIIQHIDQVDEIYSKLDIIRLNHKYEQNIIPKENEIENFQISYFNQLILLMKKIIKQIIIQHNLISEEISSFIDSSQKIDQNNTNSYHMITTTNPNNISNVNKQQTDSLNWKQLMSSIIDNTQNILVREHINTMLINFFFDTIIRMLNPWIGLFYQASFIINSYLSIISFLLVIVAILVCFNTIPCFRNEKNEQKSQKIWVKVLRIYKANVMVILLNTIFILGGLLRYLYLPNEIELLNANIAIIKAVNKVLNIILCPCVINIITSFSTVFSIFQWQLIWMSRKLSFSSLINL